MRNEALCSDQPATQPAGKPDASDPAAVQYQAVLKALRATLVAGVVSANAVPQATAAGSAGGVALPAAGPMGMRLPNLIEFRKQRAAALAQQKLSTVHDPGPR